MPLCTMSKIKIIFYYYVVISSLLLRPIQKYCLKFDWKLILNRMKMLQAKTKTLWKNYCIKCIDNICSILHSFLYYVSRTFTKSDVSFYRQQPTLIWILCVKTVWNQIFVTKLGVYRCASPLHVPFALPHHEMSRKSNTL